MTTSPVDRDGIVDVLVRYATGIDRRDEATARSYVHAVLVLGDGSGSWIEAVGSSDDDLVRSTDGWVISRRTFTLARFLSSGPPGPGSD